ncbi:hypothetical protein KDJ56_13365 [Brevibacillus composti]|uniref:Uncharacterized protein n=1 Tax=Brevibacillus composti TaxID=2796470 RepID=A0A7T5EHX2_9BACL|nr:hypothetical protein [Brevibacillus composti]QQE72934.1 hypothetical protein JD108_13420 [Brevibacillus composti]QUO40012.1 hypothetical protein KDJ56_13365 [Brevibacillus composti]
MRLLDQWYHQLIIHLREEGVITEAAWREYAGQRFLYVNSPLPPPELGICLTEAGERMTQGTVARPECIFVRSSGTDQVYRFRFRIPEDKKFCCGNLCEDCFLFRS